MKTLYFDMDGTFVDLYGVPEWQKHLDTQSAEPYRKATPLLNMIIFTHWLRKAKAKGFRIGIISWLSRNADEQFHEDIKKAKLEWLKKHLPFTEFDEIHLIPYGTPKSSVVADLDNAILFDDEQKNLLEWRGHDAIPANNMTKWFMNNV